MHPPQMVLHHAYSLVLIAALSPPYAVQVYQKDRQEILLYRRSRPARQMSDLEDQRVDGRLVVVAKWLAVDE